MGKGKSWPVLAFSMLMFLGAIVIEIIGIGSARHMIAVRSTVFILVGALGSITYGVLASLETRMKALEEKLNK
jgi:hypothetical protein